jgi:hypothetical protein
VPADLPPVRAVHARLVDALVWILVDASGRGVRRLRLSARREGAGVVILLDDDGVDRAQAALDLPAAVVHEAGLALALAREDLLRAGCRVETATASGGELHLPLRIHCPAAGGPAERAREAARPGGRLGAAFRDAVRHLRGVSTRP